MCRYKLQKCIFISTVTMGLNRIKARTVLVSLYEGGSVYILYDLYITVSKRCCDSCSADNWHTVNTHNCSFCSHPYFSSLPPPPLSVLFLFEYKGYIFGGFIKSLFILFFIEQWANTCTFPSGTVVTEVSIHLPWTCSLFLTSVNATSTCTHLDRQHQLHSFIDMWLYVALWGTSPGLC